MNQKKSLLIILLVILLILGGAYMLYPKLSRTIDANPLLVLDPQEETTGTETSVTEETNETAPQEEPAPEVIPARDFTVYDADGNAVNLFDFLGKPVVLNFWASWCEPCQMEMPSFHEKYLELGEDVQFLMVNMTNGRETLESATEFIAEMEYTFPVFYDTDLDAAMTYGMYPLPATYFIDAQGNITAYIPGAINADIIQLGIDMIQ